MIFLERLATSMLYRLETQRAKRTSGADKLQIYYSESRESSTHVWSSQDTRKRPIFVPVDSEAATLQGKTAGKKPPGCLRIHLSGHPPLRVTFLVQKPPEANVDEAKGIWRKEGGQNALRGSSRRQSLRWPCWLPGRFFRDGPGGVWACKILLVVESCDGSGG